MLKPLYVIQIEISRLIMIHSFNFSGAASPGWPFETARYPAGGFCKFIIKVTIVNLDVKHKYNTHFVTCIKNNF